MTEPDQRLLPRQADILSFRLALGFFATAIYQGAIPVLAPVLRSADGLSSARIGLLMSVFLVAYAAVQIPAGAWASRRADLALLAGFAGMVVGGVMFATSASFAGYALARVVQGAGTGMMLPSAGVLLARRVPFDRLGRAWSVYGGASGVGYVVLLLLLARVVEQGGHRLFFVVVSLIALACAAGTLGAVEVRRARVEARAPSLDGRLVLGDLWSLVRSRPVLYLGLANVSGISVSVGVLTWTPSYLHESLGAAVGTAAALTAGFAAAQFAGAPVAAWLLARMGHLPMLVLVFSGMAAALTAIPMLPGLASTFVLVLVIGLLTMLAFAPSFALIPMLVEPRLVGLAGGYLNAFGFIGAMFGPWVFGAFIDRGWGYAPGYAMLAAFGLGGVAAVVALRGALVVPPPAEVRS